MQNNWLLTRALIWLKAERRRVLNAGLSKNEEQSTISYIGNEEMGHKRHTEMLNLQAKVQQSLVEIQQQLKSAHPPQPSSEPPRPRLRPSSAFKAPLPPTSERPRSSLQHSKSVSASKKPSAREET